MPANSKLEKINKVLSENETLQNLFLDFDINYEEIYKTLINVLIENDKVLQENTVLNLVENPENKGINEKTRITIVSDDNNSLNNTYFTLYTPSSAYYVWYNTGTASDPSPDLNTTLDIYGIEVNINTNDNANQVGLATYSALDHIDEFNVDIDTSYQNIAAISEVTSISCIDDTINFNSNYSGRYFSIFDGTDEYDVWFNVDGSSSAPTVAGTLVEVNITQNHDNIEIAQRIADSLGALPQFNTSSGDGTTLVETTDPKDSNDAEELTADSVIDISIINQGSDPYTRIITRLIVENTKDGSVPNARNSYTDSPNFSFTVLRQGEDDPIAILNEQVSSALKLFPQKIETPHESHYRDYRSNGVIYPYFLKWIYFCYKYFNEEQFFFHNLLEHFTPEYDSRVISSTNNLKVYFDGIGIILDTLDQKIEDLYKLGDIDQVDDSYLQYIAQLLGYQKEDFSIKNISFRELIKNLTEIYKKKGTTYSFELFFKLLGFQADLREYYWDRDAQNPEGFASVTKFDYLYYLTTQDPRSRTEAQIENMSMTYPIQPIKTDELVLPKDLRVFNELLASHDLDEVLGYRDSDIPKDERFTYFKTNFINFKLTQFYTKQDLTAKDTDTILKYVRFLTPIYVSAFVEVVTTPWEDFFEMSNPLFNELVLEGNPGNPPWIDILLPFLSVTLKEYMPLNLSPPPESAVVLIHDGSSDENGDNVADSALPHVFGHPDHGITLTGTVQLASDLVDLTVDKYINIKLDKGRGAKIELPGNQAQTWQQLIDRLNIIFNNKGINAHAVAAGSSPDIDIRIHSNSFGTSSKIYLANGLMNDLFMNLGTTRDYAVSGSATLQGYQEFGLSINSLNDATNLETSKNYYFYINVDDDDYIELDVSGEDPANTSLDNIVDALNNHYIPSNSSNFVSSREIEYLDSTILSNGKIAIAFRDVTTNSGKLSILNVDGTLYRSDIAFSRFDCKNVTLTASNNTDIERFVLSYFDISTNQLKWTLFNNEGDKEISDRILEGPGTGVSVNEIKAITLNDDKVAILYSTAASGAYVRIINIDTALEIISPKQWYSTYISNISACSNSNGLVTGGAISSGGLLVYLDELGDPLTGDINTSTKVFTGQTIANIDLTKTDSKIFVIFRADKTTTPVDYSGYFSIWSSRETSIYEEQGPTSFTTKELDNLKVTRTSNSNLMIAYTDRTSKELFYKIYSDDSSLLKKEQLLYYDDEVSEISINLLTNDDITITKVVPNRGKYIRLSYLGELASQTVDGKLQLSSIEAGDTWDDSVEEYAAASDQGHKFVMDEAEYIYDNYSNYLIDNGFDLTRERNSYNTFYETSPNDDLIPIIEDVLTFLTTVLVSSKEFPFENIDKFGFYISRNNYISRNFYKRLSGNKEKGYFTRHQDVSDELYKDPLRVYGELNWPQWRKGKFNEEKEITRINLVETSISDFNSKYFVIYSGLTKFKIWFNLDNTGTPPSNNDYSFVLEVPLISSDSINDVYNKLADKLANEKTNNFTIKSIMPLEVESNKFGESPDIEERTASSIINTTLLQDGTISKYHNEWASWTLGIDQLSIKIETPYSYVSTGSAIFGGFSPQAGGYEVFYDSSPTGSIAGSWAIEGEAYEDTIIRFVITDTDPAVVWPSDAKIAYVSEYSGQWVEIEDTNRSLDGKTLWADINHFSFWGVIGTDTDKSSITNVEVENAKVIKKELIAYKVPVLGIFSGDGQPYGPYEEFTAPVPIGTAIFSGSSIVHAGAIYRYFVPVVGVIHTSGTTTVEYFTNYEYEASGLITITGDVENNVTDILATTEYGIIHTSGEAYTSSGEYIATVGGLTITSGSAIYTSTAQYEAGRPFGWIEFDGSATYQYTRDYYYEGSGTTTLTGDIPYPLVDNVATVTVAPIVTTGTSPVDDIILIGSTNYVLVTISGIIEGNTSVIVGYIGSGSFYFTPIEVTPDELIYNYLYESIGGYNVHGFSASRDITFYDMIAAGVLTTSGTADYTVEFETEGTGLTFAGNKADYTIEFERTASGGLFTYGIAGYTIEFEKAASGGLFTSGSSVNEVNVITSAGGLTVLSSDALYTIEFERTASGGIQILGVVDLDSIELYPEIIIAQAVASGGGSYYITFEYISSGGIVTSGSSVNEIDVTTSTGGLTITSGDSEYYPEYSRDGTGQIVMQGSSAYQEAGL